jgi:hypothetical protein
MGVLKQNEIWVQPSWLGIENTIRGKVMASPKSGRAMVSLMNLCVCPWLVRASRVLQLCTNQLVVWFVEAHVNS